MTSKNNDLERKFIESGTLDLMTEIGKVANLIDKIRDTFYKKYNLSRIQYRTLYFLYLVDEKGSTLSDLSEKLGITRPAITTLIDRMESAELVKRVSIEGDRRSIKGVITDKGKKIMDEVIPNSESLKSTFFDFLTNEEKDILYKLIIKVQNELTGKIVND